ncbi:MAG: DUF3618 domain-containing protein [Gemmatimonas sp.]|nr:DUF3618 domain-containing protein [Gemmatimonas sp.]
MGSLVFVDSASRRRCVSRAPHTSRSGAPQVGSMRLPSSWIALRLKKAGRTGCEGRWARVHSEWLAASSRQLPICETAAIRRRCSSGRSGGVRLPRSSPHSVSASCSAGSSDRSDAMPHEIQSPPNDPEAARAEIERTRDRMSHTIDEIEDVLLRKRQRLRERLDIGAKIRERPLQAAGAALVVGLVLGLLTGGGEEEPRDPKAEARAALWESRARRLLAIARSQEDELEELETAADLAAPPPIEEDEWDDDDWEAEEHRNGRSRFSAFRDVVSGRLGEYVVGAADIIADGWRRRF